MNFNPVINLIASVIHIYIWVLIIWIILNWLIYFRIVNQFQPLVRRLSEILHKLTDPPLKPLRRLQLKLLGDLGGLDLSPILLILLLYFISDVLYTYFYHYGVS